MIEDWKKVEDKEQQTYFWRFLPTEHEGIAGGRVTLSEGEWYGLYHGQIVASAFEPKHPELAEQYCLGAVQRAHRDATLDPEATCNLCGVVMLHSRVTCSVCGQQFHADCVSGHECRGVIL